ncbi:hypothetical protein PHMEG_00026277 [Phytophthora megakarya]|uniref:Crinkler (CRN) n=1 Tax=Phytophthora megakarya TaxID=4795 RepID=A0A225VAS8_9STRA|nr:hypothetical protein PHMEG_00026277 [Phytophthora megakarya]
MWVDKGSKILFQNFIIDSRSPWVLHLAIACLCLGVDVVDGDESLGRGSLMVAFSRVCAKNCGEMLDLKSLSCIVHGDPPVSNVILYKEKPLWIDLVEVREASPILKPVDGELLSQSVLRLSEQLIDNSSKNATRENLHRLAEEIRESMEFSY